MSKKDNRKENRKQIPVEEEAAPAAPETEPEEKPETKPEAGSESTPESAPETKSGETPGKKDAPDGSEALQARLAEAQKKAAEQEEKYLRLAAEYDNYRKRTAKEKEALWTEAKIDTVASLLPVYDNLERAIRQETADEAYKKGVEMTMNQLRELLGKLGITEIPALGQPFDPKLHNAVAHIDSEELGENTVAQVFQAGFQCGEKVVRFAMVQVAN